MNCAQAIEHELGELQDQYNTIQIYAGRKYQEELELLFAQAKLLCRICNNLWGYDDIDLMALEDFTIMLHDEVEEFQTTGED